MAHAREYDPNLWELRAYEADLDSLLSIEYRCPKCRNCGNCRDSINTERVSLRQEAEDTQISDSVTLDYENKRFVCHLPLRGKPEEYLATNKDDANMMWMLRQILVKWVETFILAGDARVPLFWTLSDNSRLSWWYRTRSAQIRRGTPNDHIYHLISSVNVADIPTKPDRNTIRDVGPGSEWELSALVQEGTLTPIAALKEDEEDNREEFIEGLVTPHIPDSLTRGYTSQLPPPR